VFVTGDEVVLRPVREDDLPFLQDLISDPDDAGSFLWQGFRDPREWRQRWDSSRSLITDGGGMVLIARGGERSGTISWDRHQWFGQPCWTLGIHLARPERGRGVGTRAHQLMVAYLFAQTVLNRIEAYTEVSNIAEQRALEKAGFTQEGTLRRVAFRDGQWHDGVLYSIIR
jgi:RimJ/RimL family protein N-acetyltransferase